MKKMKRENQGSFRLASAVLVGTLFFAWPLRGDNPVTENWSADRNEPVSRRVDYLTVSAACAVTVAKGVTLTIGALTGDAALTKHGAGVLEVGYMTGSTVINAHEGEVRFIEASTDTAALAGDAAFHVDASDADSFEFTGGTTNGMPFVSKWKDVRGEGYPYALHGGDLNLWGADEGDPPVLTPDRCNGLPMVDFLNGRCYSGLPCVLETPGYGGRLNWSEKLSDVREVFVVVADDESARSRGIHQFILGNNGGGAGYSFCRERTFGLLDDYAKPSLLAGFAELDGVSCTPRVTLPEKEHLVHMRATEADVVVDSFGKDRNSIWGGQRLGEVIVFSGEGVDGVTATNLSWRLRAKWFGLDTMTKLTLGASACATVSEGRSVYVKQYDADGCRSVGGSGSLRIGSFANARALEIAEGELLVEGQVDNLVAGNEAKIRFGADVRDAYCVSTREIVKDSDGNLDIQSTDARNVTVERGSLKIAMQGSTLGPAFHVDAAKTNTVVFEDGSATSVKRWKDVRLSDDKLYPSCWNSHDSQGWFSYDDAHEERVKINNPELSANGLNGLPVMDFLRASCYSQWVFQKGTRDGSARLNWYYGNYTAGISGIKEFFIVFKDNDEDWDSSICCALLGSNGSGIDFMREGGWQRGIFDWDWSKAKPDNVAAFDLDGEAQSTTRYVYTSKGWHVVHLRLKDGVEASASAFGRQGTKSLGGILIAEALIYTNAPSASEVAAVANYLNNKWHVYEADYEAPVFDSVQVATGTSVEVPAHSQVAQVSGGGVVHGESLSVSAVKVSLGDTLAFKGSLSLPAAGEVHVGLPASGSKVRAGEYDVVTWENLTDGSFDAWTLVVDGAPDGYSFKMRTVGNVLKVSVQNPGILLLVR